MECVGVPGGSPSCPDLSHATPRGQGSAILAVWCGVVLVTVAQPAEVVLRRTASQAKVIATAVFPEMKARNSILPVPLASSVANNSKLWLRTGPRFERRQPARVGFSTQKLGDVSGVSGDVHHVLGTLVSKSADVQVRGSTAAQLPVPVSTNCLTVRPAIGP